MDLKDIQFRVGLILAVMVLAGIFTTSIWRSLEEDGSHDLAYASREIGEAILTASTMGDKVDIRLSMGYGGGGNMKISVDGSLITVTDGKEREIASTYDHIVPSYPVENCNISVLERMGDTINGFVVETPVDLIVRGRDIGGERVVFVYVESDADEYQDMISLMEKELPASQGYTESVDQYVNETIYVEGGILYIESADVLEGSCPIPVILGDDFEVKDQSYDVGSTIRIDRSVLFTGENLIYSSRIFRIR